MAQLIDVVTPDLGNATDVTVIEIAVKEGSTVEKDATLLTLESDKASIDIPSSHAGKVKSIKVSVGSKVQSGALLLTLETEGNSAQPEAKSQKNEEPKPSSAKKITEKPKEPSAQSTEKPVAEPKKKAQESSEESNDSDVHAGPFVRRFARELGVELQRVSGSGPKNRIVKEDIEAYVKAQLKGASAPKTMFDLPAMPVIDFTKFGDVETVPLSRIKKISGKNLQRNWMMMPHVTQFGEADITDLEVFRTEQKALLEKKQIKLTPLVFIMKAIVATLKTYPQFNASLDSNSENLILKHYYHIGVAVDTPDGLVVPVIRDVDQKGLLQLAEELAVISDKARKKQLMPQDMQGGSFSISSLGGIGGTAFTPIINAPEVAILGVSQASHKPLYRDGEFVARLMLPLSLSYDHRVIDGADGARFMVHLINMLSDIRKWLL